MAERELQIELSEEAKDFLVEKGWDPAMGARPLRRAIQRYIEDPLADEVLRSPCRPGSTIEVGKAPEDDENDMTITIVKPKERKRETVGVGAKGDAREEGSSTDPADEDAPELPGRAAGRSRGPAGRAGRAARRADRVRASASALLPDRLHLAAVRVDAHHCQLAEGARGLPGRDSDTIQKGFDGTP